MYRCLFRFSVTVFIFIALLLLEDQQAEATRKISGNAEKTIQYVFSGNPAIDDNNEDRLEVCRDGVIIASAAPPEHSDNGDNIGTLAHFVFERVEKRNEHEEARFLIGAETVIHDYHQEARTFPYFMTTEEFTSHIYGIEVVRWRTLLEPGTDIAVKVGSSDTGVVSPLELKVINCLLPGRFPSTITIRHFTEPATERNFFFDGDLGRFKLNLDIPTRIFTVDSGTYQVIAQTPANWFLAHAGCVPNVRRGDRAILGADVLLNTDADGLDISVTDGAHLICTFVHHKQAVVRAIVYNDQNGDGQRNVGEAPLPGWRLQLSDFFTGPDVSDPSRLTNELGKASFTNVRPDKYELCLEMQEGWFNTQPGVLDQPCYSFYAPPGQIVTMSFGNTTTPPVINRASNRHAGAVLIEPLPEHEAEDVISASVFSDDAWLNAEDEVTNPSIYLPLIRR